MPVNTDYLLTPSITSTSPGVTGVDRISLGTFGVATQPAVTFASDKSLGLFGSGASTLAVSYGTFDLHTQSVRLSLATVADASSSVAGELLLVFQASGLSLIYSSGDTIYSITSSALSAAAP